MLKYVGITILGKNINGFRNETNEKVIKHFEQESENYSLYYNSNEEFNFSLE